MTEVDYASLQERYGGRYVARHNGEVIASAETYNELSDQLEEAAVQWAELIIEYVEPRDSIRVY
jgi:hypothetical protein